MGHLLQRALKSPKSLKNQYYMFSKRFGAKSKKSKKKSNFFFTKGGPYVNWPISVIFHEIPNPWKSLKRPSPVYSFKRSRNMPAMIVSVRFLWILGFFRFFGSFLTIFWPKMVIFRHFFYKSDQKSIFSPEIQRKRCFLSTRTSLETIKTNGTF